MTITQDLEVVAQSQEEDVIFPPSDIYSDEPPLESDLHLRQIMLLIQCLEWYWRDRQDFYACGNLTIYYSPNQRKSEFFRGPDFFAVLGTERKPRKSWVVWAEEGKYPHIIIEILSSGTAATDRNLKKQIYQDTFRTPDYFWFHPNTLEFQGFHLVDGIYQEILVNERGWRWSQQLELFLGVHESQLRYFTASGDLIPTPEELALQAQQQQEQAEQQILAERQQREQAQQQILAERQQREQAQQQNLEMEGLLARYRERFGELPD